MKDPKPGRFSVSNRERVTVTFKEKPDIERLARALTALAQKLAESEKQEKEEDVP